MKIIAINGSPKKQGNTKTALNIMAEVFKQNNHDFEVIEVGIQPLSGCIGCGGCDRNQDKKCVLKDAQPINDAMTKLVDADAIILASPVHYANLGGALKCFLDRIFMISGTNGGLFSQKIGASVVAVRRSGGTATLSSLNYYLSISEMVIASGNYWAVAHGRTPGELAKDDEGVQTLQQLAGNISWLLNMINATKDSIEKPKSVEKIWYNFIRE